LFCFIFSVQLAACFLSSTSADEHLFDLVLPKPCSIGHIDVKFTLHPLCTSPPNIQVTLLKQSISNIGASPSPTSSSQFPTEAEVKAEADAAIDFSLYADGVRSRMSTPSERLTKRSCPTVGAEVICGPVDLSSYIDLSGTQGSIPLTSVKLLKVKAKSFLLQLKAKTSTGDRSAEKPPLPFSVFESLHVIE